MMKLFLIYSVVLVLAVFNGIFSPHSFMVFALQGIWYPVFLPSPLKLMFILSGVISAVLHLLVTGIPAALAEKFFSLQRMPSSLLWLGVMLFPTARTLQHLGWL